MRFAARPLAQGLILPPGEPFSEQDRPVPGHPSPGALLRFAAGQASRDEACEVVRHLLRRHAPCTAVSRDVFVPARPARHRPAVSAALPRGEQGDLSRHLSSREWQALGFDRRVGKTLAAEVGSLERLGSMTREQLFAIPNIGHITVRHCETVLGRSIPRDSVHAESGAPFWLRMGFSHSRAMVDAGYRTLDDLAEVTREEFLAHHQLGETALARCEELLGRPLPSYREDWLARGLPESLARRLAAKLARACIHTREDLAAVTREELLSLGGVADGALVYCERILGHPLPSAVEYWTGRGLPEGLAWWLSRHRVMNLDDLRRLTRGDLRQLGYSVDEIRRLATRESSS